MYACEICVVCTCLSIVVFLSRACARIYLYLHQKLNIFNQVHMCIIKCARATRARSKLNIYVYIYICCTTKTHMMPTYNVIIYI